MNSRDLKYFRLSFLGTACAVLLLINASCARSAATEPRVTTASESPTVAVAEAKRADVSSTLLLTAEFEPFQEIDVMAKVSGYVKQINVDIGDRVREGQILATLEIPEMQDDMRRAAAAIEEGRAQLATARDELVRAQSAHDIAHLSYSRVLDVSKREPGLVPQQEVDEAHSRDLVAEAQMSTAQSRIAECDQRIRVSQAEEGRVKTLYQYAVITAPFDGVVTKRYANSGALIQAGTASQTQAMPIIRLSQNGLLRLALPVPESAVPLVHLGSVVNVRVSALKKDFAGHVARFSEKVDESTRTMKTEVDVPNSSLVLVPGMYAEVNLTTDQHRNALTVPVEAIDGSGNSTQVLTVGSDGTVQAVAVQLGLETARDVEIQSGGLKDGDRVIVGSRSGLKPGIKVQPKIIRMDAGSKSKS